MYKKKLMNELKALRKHPVEGFSVSLPNESNLLVWHVLIEGPKNTLYEGALLKATLRFPSDYPFSPPVMAFTSKMWHPNVYEDGKVCISILHKPDPTNPEEDDVCWSPIQRVETILLSVISLLSDPNINSPANVDAAKEFRDRPDLYAMNVLNMVALSQRNTTAEEREKYNITVEDSAPATTSSSSSAVSSSDKTKKRKEKKSKH